MGKMVVVNVKGLPVDIHRAKLSALSEGIRKAVADPVIPFNDVCCFFDTDLLPIGLGEEIIVKYEATAEAIEVMEMYWKENAHTRVKVAIEDFFPGARVEQVE